VKPIKIGNGSRRGDWNRGFAVEILYPGQALKAGDSGIGAIGRIDRARVAAGHVVAMHPHRDDEILTYVRAGSMLHRDSVQNEEKVTETRLMMMNAGHTFQHEEEILGPDATEALQIFLRPRATELEPKVQFHDFGEAFSRDVWRLLAAPEGAPLEVRAQAWVQDVRLSAGASLPLPALQAAGAVRLLYVFAGEARIGALTLHAGESAYLEEAGGTVEAVSEADVVLFTTDPAAATFKCGMFSGNLLAA